MRFKANVTLVKNLGRLNLDSLPVRKKWDIHQFEICHMIAGPTFTDQSDQKEDVRFWPSDNDVRIYRAGQADLKEQVKALLE